MMVVARSSRLNQHNELSELAQKLAQGVTKISPVPKNKM